MDQETLAGKLAELPLGPVRYFDSTGSTNLEAAEWAEAGGPDLSLVVADEQTAGRGRMGRKWFTPPGAALAFSLILRPEGWLSLEAEPPDKSATAVMRLTALGALAVCEGLRAYAEARALQVASQIKWPNDVIVNGRKLAGVLTEASWEGARLSFAILGTGINVAPASLPPAEGLTFPATCFEGVLGMPVDRWDLLQRVLAALLDWLPEMASAEFMEAWGSRLAYKGEWVQVRSTDPAGAAGIPLEGQVLGLNADGSLGLRTRSGKVMAIHSGEVHLRPVDRLGK
jgi:BirA family biotin operon repressor/biotin-[acetyl-CoA-carboxylase] ligase